MGFNGAAHLPKVCIIGAGPSGFTTAKRLKDANIPYDCFEVSDNIGGNWYFNNPNGMSSCYESLHIDTSKWRLAFEDFPVPKNWPDFPHHSQLLQYFHDYVDHFGVRETITFNTGVDHAARRDEARRHPQDQQLRQLRALPAPVQQWRTKRARDNVMCMCY